LIKKGLSEDKRLILTAEGMSMAPSIIEGDKLVIESRSEFEEGDIIAFCKEERHQIDIIVHRIIEIREDGAVRTQGDNIHLPDPDWVTRDQIIGVVKKVIDRN